MLDYEWDYFDFGIIWLFDERFFEGLADDGILRVVNAVDG
jgi:hypothetical protein